MMWVFLAILLGYALLALAPQFFDALELIRRSERRSGNAVAEPEPADDNCRSRLST
jgi:hypothetical protein